MQSRVNGQQELDRVNMFIRALSAEMAQPQDHNESPTTSAIAIEMEEALFELRLRKLLISAMVDSDRVTEAPTRH